MEWDNSAFQERERRSRSLLQEIASPRAPDYLAARALAHLRARKRPRWRVWFWRAWIPASFVWMALISWSVLVKSPEGFQAPVNQAMAIRLETSTEELKKVVRTEINLPSGVAFHSRQFPSISDIRTLHLKNLSKSLSFVVKGKEYGKHEIQVRYFDKTDQVMMVRTVTIHFMNRT